MTHDVDLVGLERLEAFAERIPGFTWSACVASADSDYPRKGYVTEHIAAQHLHEGDVDIYSVRAAADGRGGRALPARAGRAPGEFLLRKFAASAA